VTDPSRLTSPQPSDRRRYRLIQGFATAVPLMVFAIGSAAQANLLQLSGEPVPADAVIGVVERLVSNLTACAVVIAGILLFPGIGRSWPVKVALLAGIGLGGALTRTALQLALGVHELSAPGPILLDLPGAGVTTAISLGIGLAAAELDVRLLLQERHGALQAIRAATALQQLQAEELRVRRVVAEGLHGTVQQRLVIIAAHARALQNTLATGAPVTAEDLARLEALHADVESLREQDVRGYSQLLYPSGVDMGLAQAVRILLRRLASTIAVTVRIDDSVVRADDPGTAPLPTELRILAIRVLEEGVSNALRHGHAGTLNVSVSVDADGVLDIVLDDDGSGAGDTDPARGSGLATLSARLADAGGSLALAAGPLGGARLTARLPLGSTFPAPASSLD
jgi:two-component system sensor histidine kinase UhpB